MKRVLVIEDTPAIRESIADVLRYNGYEVLTARDGSDGLDAAREHLPDIIICDIMMPNMTGNDVLRELRGDSKTAGIPFIFLTARTDPVDIRAGMEQGADDYLTKPFKERDLLATLKTRLEKQAALETLQLRTLTRKFLHIQEHNRRTWARTLQDHISQPLVGLKLSLQNTDQLMPRQFQEKISDIQDLLDEVLAQTMLSINTIWPVILDELGLLPALLHLFDQLFLETGMRVEFKHAGLDTSFSQDIKITTYRIFQEALSNAVQYAQVSVVDAAIWVEHDHLHIDIEDHGQGFDIDRVMGIGKAGGLVELNDRLTAFGVGLTIYTTPGTGVRLITSIPLKTESLLPDFVGDEAQDSSIDFTDLSTKQDEIPESRITVLIALDNQIIREGLKRLLEMETYIQVFGEGSDRNHILKRVHEIQPDVLILGLATNGMSNLDLIQPIKALLPELRVLVFTTQSNDFYLYESLRAGAVGCIPSTIGAQDLIEAVQRVVQGEDYWSASVTKESLQLRADAYQAVSPELARLSTLTPREQEILRMIAQGSTSKEIASVLSISPRTAETHRTNIASKLGLRTQADLIRLALKHGLSS